MRKSNLLLKLISIASVFFIYMQNTFANFNFGQLHIQISNQTGNECRNPIFPKVIHGKLHSSPPNILLNGLSYSFDMEQAWFYGPEVILTYDCTLPNESTINIKRVTFKVAQDYSYIQGHTPFLTLLSSTGLTATASTIIGSSRIFESVGVISVNIDKV